MRANLKAFLFLPVLTVAMDDIPLYLDAGCTNKSIPGSYAQGPSDMNLPTGTNGGGEIPINCTEELTGTDAIEIKLLRALNNGEYFDFQVKTPVDRYFLLQGYKDIRFWVKNKLSTPASFSISAQNAAYSVGTAFDTTVAGGADWEQFVIPLSRIADTGLNALQFSQPSKLSANGIDILIDSITITDGTENGSLSIPTAVHSPTPSDWGPDFLIGGLDNQALGASTITYQAGGEYRYQYIMPETFGYYTPSGKGYIYDYAKESDSLGVKTAFIYYNLGKSGEGYSAITANLASASYMSLYFLRYDTLLNQAKAAGGKDYMIVLEPDMYGFLMRGPNGANYPPIEDPTLIPVNMAEANSISGKTYEADLKGWATYMVKRAKAVLGDSTIVGHMPNHWGVNIPGMVGNGRKEAHIISGMTIARFLNRFGPDGIGDVVFVEKADRDAGIKTDANWMWDSTGYGKYFLWTRCIAHGTSLPICGWQVSEAHSNFSTVAQRDNAVEYLLAHPDRWVDGGFAGILFGAGDASCTNYGGTTDSGWFRTHMAAYEQNPYPLPTVTAIHPKGAPSGTSLRALQEPDGFRLEGWTGSAKVRVWDLSGNLLYSRNLSSGDPVRLAQAHGIVLWGVGDRARLGSGSVLLH